MKTRLVIVKRRKKKQQIDYRYYVALKPVNSKIEHPIYDQEYYEIGEDIICKHFGCGRKLSPQETLFSDYCVNHNKSKNKVYA